MKKHPAMTREARRRRAASAWFLAPGALGVLVFFVLPFAVIVYYSLVDDPVGRQFVGLTNYKSLLQNAAFRLAVKNSLGFSALAVPLAVLLSLCLALALEKPVLGKSRLRAFFLSPLVVPVASVVLIWQVVFHENGALNSLLALFGAEGVDWMGSRWSVLVIALLFLWKNLGYNMVLFMAALSAIPREPLEAAMVDGAGRRVIFFRFKLRYLTPTLFFVLVMSLVNSFKVFREVYLLTGDYPYEGLYLLQHFMNNTFRSLDWQKLSAAAVLMLLAIALVIALLFWAEARAGKDLEQ